jgi:hypothetical protein
VPAPTVTGGTVTTTAFNALAEYVDDTRTGLMRRAERVTSGTATTTTEQPFMRLDDIAIDAGYAYLITVAPLIVDSTVAGDLITMPLRASTSGAATTASAQLTALVDTSQSAAGSQRTASFSKLYVASITGSLSLLLSYVRSVGTGNVRIIASTTYPAEIVILRVGIDVGDTGIDL